jgi:hypothetical protein
MHLQKQNQLKKRNNMSLKKKFKRLLKKAQYQIAIIGDTGEDLRIGKVLLRIIVSGIPNHDPHLFIPDAAKQYNFKIAGINEYKFNQKVLTYTKDYIYRNFPNVDPGKITLYNFWYGNRCYALCNAF